jgi:hypothetical protein
MNVMMSEEIGLQSANKGFIYLVKDLPDRHDQLSQGRLA